MTEERLKELWNSSAERQELIIEVRRLRRLRQVLERRDDQLLDEVKKGQTLRELLSTNIVQNVTDTHIFITTKWERDSAGRPAKIKTDYSVGPGQKIDLNIIGLNRIDAALGEK